MNYDVIIADPPWSYYGSQTKWAAAGKEYQLMTDDELLAYRYPLSSNGILFMWATGPRLDFAIRCIEAHGLHYRGLAFVWIKTRADGGLIGAQGVRPSITKPLTELVLAASYRRTGRPLRLHDESICQTVLAPRGEHSQKPEEVQDRLERMYPLATKAEFFARRHREGWACHGNELEGCTHGQRQCNDPADSGDPTQPGPPGQAAGAGSGHDRVGIGGTVDS